MALNNVCYDVLTVLQSKLEALTVYDRYLQDCQAAGDERCRQLLAEIRQDDERHAERLRAEIERLVREGKFH